MLVTLLGKKACSRPKTSCPTLKFFNQRSAFDMGFNSESRLLIAARYLVLSIPNWCLVPPFDILQSAVVCRQ